MATAAQMAQWAAAQARLAAAGITGYTVGPGGITIARANALIAAQNRAAAQAAAAAAKAANAEAQAQIQQQNAANRAAANLAKLQLQQQNAANAQALRQANTVALVQANATKTETAVANQIAAFQSHLLALVAQAGKNILNPAKQAQLNNLQTQFAKSIAAKGGAYVPIDLAAISPDLQNSILAQQGVGLTNAGSAQQANALASLYESGAIAQYLQGAGTVSSTGDNGAPGTPTVPNPALAPPSISGVNIPSTSPANTSGDAGLAGLLATLAAQGQTSGAVGGSVPVASPVDLSGAGTVTPTATATGLFGLSDTELAIITIGLIGLVYVLGHGKKSGGGGEHRK